MSLEIEEMQDRRFRWRNLARQFLDEVFARHPGATAPQLRSLLSNAPFRKEWEESYRIWLEERREVLSPAWGEWFADARVRVDKVISEHYEAPMGEIRRLLVSAYPWKPIDHPYGLNEDSAYVIWGRACLLGEARLAFDRLILLCPFDCLDAVQAAYGVRAARIARPVWMEQGKRTCWRELLARTVEDVKEAHPNANVWALWKAILKDYPGDGRRDATDRAYLEWREQSRALLTEIVPLDDGGQKPGGETGA